MDKDSFWGKISQAIPCDQILLNVPMKEHTSFKIGGNADIMVLPKRAEDIMSVIKICQEADVPYFVMGCGSNLLVRDGGIRGAVIKLYKGFSNIVVQDHTVKAQAGASLAGVARLAARKGLSGLEFASGIPGSVGGGIIMNAGAYGREMKDVTRRVLVYKNGTIEWLDNVQAGFVYRSSNIKKDKQIVLEAEFELGEGYILDIEADMDQLLKKRSEKQPLDFPSCGSTFKRPQGGYAAELIEKSGLKGTRVGGAMVSPKHSGFVVNTGNATAADVLKLMELVQKRVFETFGVVLQPEAEIVGEESSMDE